MPKGPLGAPRPFSKYRILINPHEQSVRVLKVGPFGGPRPLAKDNPPVEDEEVAECILSEAGMAFGAGVVSRGATTDIEDLSPEARQRAMELAEKWCRGSMEAQSIEELEEDEVIPSLTRARESLRRAVGSEADIDIPMKRDPVDVESEVIDETTPQLPPE